MKKVCFILIAVALISITVASCKKSCTCDIDAIYPAFLPSADYRDLITRVAAISTQEDCIKESGPLMDSVSVRCVWE